VVLDLLRHDRGRVVVLLLLEVAGERGVALVETLPAAPAVDRAALGDGRQPGAGIARDAGLRPLLQRRHERVLGELLCQADVARPAGEPGDELAGLDAPHRLDGIGGRAFGLHQYRSSRVHVCAGSVTMRRTSTLPCPSGTRL